MCIQNPSQNSSVRNRVSESDSSLERQTTGLGANMIVLQYDDTDSKFLEIMDPLDLRTQDKTTKMVKPSNMEPSTSHATENRENLSPNADKRLVKFLHFISPCVALNKVCTV